MPVQLLTWTRVSEAAPQPTCELKSISPEMNGLLSNHLGNLRRRASEGLTPAAEFVSDEARSLFEALRTGPSEAFLETANQMANALISRMDQRTSSGFLVVLRNEADSITEGGVLKMEVTDPYAAYVERDPEEGEILQAVRNLLDTPGRLQKGAVVPDERQDSEVVVGDRLLDTALYFLDALGIRQLERASTAVVRFVNIANDVIPEQRDDVAAAVQRSSASSVTELIEEIPDISDEAKEELRNRARQRRRPIQAIDTRKARVLKKIVRAAGITITGRVEDVNQRLKVEQRTQGGWRITIDVDDEPRIEFK